MLDPHIGSRPKVFTTIGERGMMLSSHKDGCYSLPPTTTMQSPVCHDVIESVLPVLEQFLTIRDTVAMSMTCHGFRNEIVDQSTNEIKISHFDTSPERLADIMLHDGNSARSTSVFIQNALTRIHFPSLLSLNVDLSSTVRQPSILQDIFSCLVSKIAIAKKLRKLRLEALELLTLPTEMDIVMKPTMEAFGRNLEECCPDLKELSISVGSWAWLYRRNPIGDFVHMLRGVICKKHGFLENLAFSWEFEFDEEEDLNSAEHVICLFSSIFGLERLHSLSLDLRCPFMSEMLLRAVNSNKMDERASNIASLQNLQISIEEDHDEFASECSHAHLLDYIDRFTEIKQLKLSLPRRCFQDSRSLLAWKRFIFSQQHITHLILGFDSYSDEDDWIVEVLASLVKNLTSLVYFQCCNLMNVNRKLLIEVINNLLRERGHKLKEDAIMVRNGKRRILMEDLLVAGPKRVDCNVLTSETPSNFKYI